MNVNVKSAKRWRIKWKDSSLVENLRSPGGRHLFFSCGKLGSSTVHPVCSTIDFIQEIVTLSMKLSFSKSFYEISYYSQNLNLKLEMKT